MRVIVTVHLTKPSWFSRIREEGLEAFQVWTLFCCSSVPLPLHLQVQEGALLASRPSFPLPLRCLPLVSTSPYLFHSLSDFNAPHHPIPHPPPWPVACIFASVTPSRQFLSRAKFSAAEEVARQAEVWSLLTEPRRAPPLPR